MDIIKYNKILIVSLCDNYSNTVGQALSQKLGMLFCNTKDLVEYELIDKDALEKTATRTYLKNAEKSVLKHIASFENVVVSINFDYLVHNLNLFQENSLIVFLNLSRKFVKDNGNVVDLISYENRSEKLCKISQIALKTNKTDIDYVCEKIIEKLGGLL